MLFKNIPRRFAVPALALCALLILVTGFVFLLRRTADTSEGDDTPRDTGSPVYILGMHASDDELWLLRQKDGGTGLYRLGEDGTEQYVRQLPGNTGMWNGTKESFCFLTDENTISAFDPSTGDITESSPLSGEYGQIRGADGDHVFLQQELYGEITAVSFPNGEETPLDISGSLLNIYSGCLLVWDHFTHELSCHEYSKNRLVWRVDLSAYFSSGAPVLCESGGSLYISGGNRDGDILIIPDFTEKSEVKKSRAEALAVAMADAGDYVICAKAYSGSKSSIVFSALYPDDTSVELAVWEEKNYYHGSLLMEIFDGRLYCTLTAEDGLFSFALPDGG